MKRNAADLFNKMHKFKVCQRRLVKTINTDDDERLKIQKQPIMYARAAEEVYLDAIIDTTTRHNYFS
jgi:hypothetical protein